MLRSVFPRAHQKYFSLPLLGPITDGFDDWLTASGFTLGSRTLAIHFQVQIQIEDREMPAARDAFNLGWLKLVGPNRVPLCKAA